MPDPAATPTVCAEPAEPAEAGEEPPVPEPTGPQPPGAEQDDHLREVLCDFSLERYRHILQQIHTVNENVYRFLAFYQALATATVGAAVALFVGYRGWGVSPAVARAGVVGLLCLETLVALFTALFVLVGVLAWLGYRREECELTDRVVHAGFRERPRPGGFLGWYETYIVGFIVVSTAFLWVYALVFVLPAIT